VNDDKHIFVGAVGDIRVDDRRGIAENNNQAGKTLEALKHQKCSSSKKFNSFKNAGQNSQQ
jgi:hypothetical protein